MIKEESIDILRSAKEALSGFDRKDLEKAVDLIEHIASVSDNEIELLLQKVQVESEIRDSRILFFDIVSKAREIKLYALKAKLGIIDRKYGKVRELLKKIVELGDTEVKEISRLNRIILYKKAKIWDKVVLESAFVLFTRNRILPFVSAMAGEIDSFFAQKKSLEKSLGSDLKDFSDSLKEKVFVRQQFLLEDDSLGSEIRHPVIISHNDLKLSFRKLFRDYSYICVLGVMSYPVLARNPLKKLNLLRKIENFYAKLAFDFDSDFDMLVIEIRKLASEIRKLNRKMGYMKNKLDAIASKKAVKDFSGEYSRFLVLSEKKLHKCFDVFELECQNLHDAITRYVVREREKLQDSLDRSSL